MKSGMSEGNDCWHLLGSDQTFLCGSDRPLATGVRRKDKEPRRVCARCLRLALESVMDAPVANDVVPHHQAGHLARAALADVELGGRGFES